MGADGILQGPMDSQSCDFGLKIFNLDESVAEKSGNGLRIFARSLWDSGLVTDNLFTVERLGGTVSYQVCTNATSVKEEMGIVSFGSSSIPVVGVKR